MGVAENKELVRRFYEEVWDRGNVAFAHEVFADDYVRHDLRPTEALPGAAGMPKIAADFRRAFPDARWRVDFVSAKATSSPLVGPRLRRIPVLGATSSPPVKPPRSRV